MEGVRHREVGVGRGWNGVGSSTQGGWLELKKEPSDRHPLGNLSCYFIRMSMLDRNK